MRTQLENVMPRDIETRSFEIITEELGEKKLIPGTELIVKDASTPVLILIMQIICAFRKEQWKKLWKL